MGDIATHAEIFHHLQTEILEDLSNAGSIAGDIRFFELGNYLTDTSQIRDPVAFLVGRMKTYETILQKAGLIASTLDFLIGTTVEEIAKNYSDDTWGTYNYTQDPTKIDKTSALSEFLSYFALAAAIQEFANDNDPNKWFEHQDVIDAHNNWYRLYLPYEHLDYPSYASTIPRERSTSFSQHSNINCEESQGKRNTYEYFENQVAALAGGFASAHEKYLRLKDSKNERLWQDLYMQLARASHAFEDFFFHSNFVEHWFIRETIRNMRRSSSRGVIGPDSYIFGTIRFVEEFRRAFPDLKVKDVRNVLRRVLRPFDKSEVHRGKSRFDQRLYTGGFGERDIYHTIYKFIVEKTQSRKHRGMIHLLTTSSVSASNPEAKYSPLRYLSTDDLRSQLSDDYIFARVLQTHRYYISNGYYERILEEFVRGNVMIGGREFKLDPEDRLDRQAKELILKALKTDYEIGVKHHHVNVDRDLRSIVGDEALHVLMEEESASLGVFGVLLTLVRDMQCEINSWKKVQAQLDSTKSYYDPRYESGGSGARIGSHSLLAKDAEPFEDTPITPTPGASPRRRRLESRLDRVAQALPVDEISSPFREETMPIAKRMTQYIHTLFFESDVPIDWLTLLRAILCHPNDICDLWPEKALNDIPIETKDITSVDLTDPLNIANSKVEMNKAQELVESMYRQHLASLLSDWRRLLANGPIGDPKPSPCESN